MLRLIPTATAHAVLGWLWQTGQKRFCQNSEREQGSIV